MASLPLWRTQPPTTAVWDRRYSKKTYAYGTEPNDFLREVAPRYLNKDVSVLCLGEGEGRNAVWLASMMGCVCTAIDASRVGLAKARRLAAERGQSPRVRTVVMDLADFEPSRPGKAGWGGIVSIFCHLNPEVRSRLHSACVAALAPGGTVVVEAYAPGQLHKGTGGPEDVERLMTPEMLSKDFEGLEILVAREVEREVNEGSYHKGLGVVVQFIARKPCIQSELSAEPVSDTKQVGVTCASPVTERSVQQYGLADQTTSSCQTASLTSKSADQKLHVTGGNAAHKRYCAMIDEVFDGHLKLSVGAGVAPEIDSQTQNGECNDAADNAPEVLESNLHHVFKRDSGDTVKTPKRAQESDIRDHLLENASLNVRLAISSSQRDGRCRYCWMPQRRCFCMSLQDLTAENGNIEWIVLCHPQEFLRSTSSGKLIAQVLGGEFLIYDSCPAHMERLDVVLTDSRTHLFFPHQDSKSVESVAEAMRTLAAEDCMSSVFSAGHQNELLCESKAKASLLLLVLDGTWEQANVMRRLLLAKRPGLPHIQLSDEIVGQHESPLYNVLKPGAGKERMSTFEACALFLTEAACVVDWGVHCSASNKVLHSMQPLTEAVAHERGARMTQPRRKPRASDQVMERWVAALQGAAHTSECPPGVRCCSVCGVKLATPFRMPGHIQGRRHCLAVAEQHLGRRCGQLPRGQPGAEPASSINDDEAAAVFHRLSTLPMSECCPEPPDAALIVVVESRVER